MQLSPHEESQPSLFPVARPVDFDTITVKATPGSKNPGLAPRVVLA